jgi:hypothetical protein
MSILKTLANLFGKKQQRMIQKRASFRPRLEALEDRLTPYNINTWVGPAGGFWSAPTNWSLGSVPGSNDDIVFGGQFGANTASTDNIPNLTVHRVSYQQGFTATTTFSFSVSLTSSTDFTQYGAFTLDPGASITSTLSFYQNGSVVAGGGASISAGSTFALIGSTTVTTPGPSGTPGLTLTGGIDQSGTITVFGGVTLQVTGDYTITSAGGDTLMSTSTLNYTGYSGSIMNVQGTISMGGAVLNSSVQINLNVGTIVSSGAGDTIIGAVQNNGNIQWGGFYHNLTITGSYTAGIPGGTLTMRIQSSAPNDTLTINGTANLGGSLVVNASGSLPPGSIWNLIYCNNPFSGAFSSVSTPPPPPGRSWSFGTTFTGGSWVFQIWD